MGDSRLFVSCIYGPGEWCFWVVLKGFGFAWRGYNMTGWLHLLQEETHTAGIVTARVAGLTEKRCRDSHPAQSMATPDL